jgi:hypothetical protein
VSSGRLCATFVDHPVRRRLLDDLDDLDDLVA